MAGGGGLRQPQEQDGPKVVSLTSCSSLVVVSLGLVGFVEYSLVMPVMAQVSVASLEQVVEQAGRGKSCGSAHGTPGFLLAEG